MKLRLLVSFVLAAIILVLPVSSVLAAPTANITITATPGRVSISVDPDDWTVDVEEGDTVWADTGLVGPGTWPLAVGDCHFLLENDGTRTIDVGVKIDPATFTGTGDAWNVVTTGTPGTDGTLGLNEIEVILYKATDVEVTNGRELSASSTNIIEDMAAEGTLNIELAIMAGTFSSNDVKTGTILFTATKS